MFQKKFDSPARQAPKLKKLKLVVYNPNTKKFIIDDTTQYTEEELADFPVKGSKGKGKKQASEVDSDLEEDEQDQLDEDEEVRSGGAETDVSVVKAFWNLRHDDNIETGDEEEAEQPSADKEGGYDRYRSQVGDDRDKLLKAVTQMSGMLNQLIHKVDVLQETVHEMQVGQVGLQAQLEALQQVALGMPLTTSATVAPMTLMTPPEAPLSTSRTLPLVASATLPEGHLMTSATAAPMTLMTSAIVAPMTSTTPPEAPLLTSMTVTPVPVTTSMTSPLMTSTTMAPVTLMTPPEAPLLTSRTLPLVASATPLTQEYTASLVHTPILDANRTALQGPSAELTRQLRKVRSQREGEGKLKRSCRVVE
ncbi:hypothetical protein WOLCODRAFT_158632 [Wolfiporia cocos MD-104 SS10]|uniref:Uncharacterized protein n=1 Tax=Wolfiporia cocos (strain MD-104) TaxID=742152 RepID=A0A2H3JA07_WOLCO|nr:hypothetical protein WOLCODRAFT_158632 [Wolfiporia cocos MD-104 SS10]